MVNCEVKQQRKRVVGGLSFQWKNPRSWMQLPILDKSEKQMEGMIEKIIPYGT
jgi:hypothetical protein